MGAVRRPAPGVSRRVHPFAASGAEGFEPAIKSGGNTFQVRNKAGHPLLNLPTLQLPFAAWAAIPNLFLATGEPCGIGGRCQLNWEDDEFP